MGGVCNSVSIRKQGRIVFSFLIPFCGFAFAQEDEPEGNDEQRRHPDNGRYHSKRAKAAKDARMKAVQARICCCVVAARKWTVLIRQAADPTDSANCVAERPQTVANGLEER